MTLLECEVAVIVLSMLVVGMVKLLGSHEHIVSTLDEWTRDEPVYRVIPPVDELRRTIGVPARLQRVDDETGPPIAYSETALPIGESGVVVFGVRRDLDEQSIKVTVRRIAVVPEVR